MSRLWYGTNQETGNGKNKRKRTCWPRHATDEPCRSRGSYDSLKAKKLNMAVLIATGVLAAYLFSVLLTAIRPESETFYEAAALLVTFVLFGHWMEMKSRRGTSDALRALFNLVPPQARVLRNGKETLIPTSEVKLGDIVILKPG